MAEPTLCLPSARLAAWQAHTFRFEPARRLRHTRDAVRYADERGFLFFWPIKGMHFPSLWGAVAGDRPVAKAHRDPGHKTWGWKDRLLPTRRWYYGKLLRGKATIVSLAALPYFYALSDNLGEPEEDVQQLYADGKLSPLARDLFERLRRDGAMDTVTLRRALHLTERRSDSPFERAMNELQRQLLILPVGVARTGAWRYSFRYELLARHLPEVPTAARPITPSEARAQLLHHAFEALGAAPARQVTKLLGWEPGVVERALAARVAAGELVAGVVVEGQRGPHFALPSLVAPSPEG